MNYPKLFEHEGNHSLILPVCTWPEADAVVEAAGHTPNGYFWEGIVRRLIEVDAELAAHADGMDFDPEGDTFVAYGADPAPLKALDKALRALLGDPPALAALLAAADAEGFDFDD
ncbi:MAG: hypothetical protein KC613_25080 [Myxococcales bacterium]|nr:hypothetical protein [Myxococcales bacterium]MCB9523963.1 hypothetical protein [Myxococcales bacterium]